MTEAAGQVLRLPPPKPGAEGALTHLLSQRLPGSSPFPSLGIPCWQFPRPAPLWGRVPGPLMGQLEVRGIAIPKAPIKEAEGEG